MSCPERARKVNLALVDKLQCAVALRGQLGQKRSVGSEFVAGQTGVALGADLPRRQQTPAIGQDPVGALVEGEHVVEVARVDGQFACVGGQLPIAQELGLLSAGQGVRIDHSHLWCEMAEVALHDVQRDAGVEKAGCLGVPETVSALKVHKGSRTVTHVQASGQLGEQVA